MDSALERLGLAAVAEKRPGECSGGQRQRAALARALVAGPDVFLVDEPTSALDAASADLVLDLLREECARGRAVVMVTHDERSAARADRIVEVGDWRA